MSSGAGAGIIADSFARAIAAAKEGDEDFSVTLESRHDPDKWIQLTGDAINVAYPWTSEPTAELKRRGVTFPRSVAVLSWEAGKFATFEHGAEPMADLVLFVERYAREILGVEPSESAFIVSTGS